MDAQAQDAQPDPVAAHPDSPPVPDPPGAADGAPTEPADPALGAIAERLRGVESQLVRANERAAHREAIIDRLHAENQELRAGERRAVLEPAITDLMQLYEQLVREGEGMLGRGEAGAGALLQSLADDVLLALERIGIEPFCVEVGDAFRSEVHRPLSVVDTADPDLANTVARVATQGFRDTTTGRVRKRAHAHFHRYAPAAPAARPTTDTTVVEEG